ncbi:inter-alpha-trypsin inhibitor heavy chain H3-like [Sebastes fasciatus]|uniref:inter-alpha-trypsin inhibitor heavy chain H3-like n=1 Tax=Sebastes fasciatus TaxID=394691 RepID=UPI003D9F0204
MSGLQGVGLLLLWGSVCLWLPGLARGALVISRDHEDLQETSGAARSLQKRSTNEDKVEVYSVKVECTVTSRFAHTVMTSKAVNKANSSQEIFFEVDLPKTAFIVNFSMEIDGQMYVGEVKEKEKAKKQYEKAVSSGQTAGLVKVSGRKMEKFSVSVNIAAESNVTFVLTHEELLQRKLGQYEIMTRVKPKQPVQEFQIVTNIYEPQGIAFVDASATFLSNELLPLVEKTVTDKKAHISFSPTMDQQRKCAGCDGTLIDGDFIIKYDVNRAKSLGDIQIVNGYFVHFFAPPDLTRVPKNVVFVIDRSGSMSGTKMAQTREALLLILQDLHVDDHFALVQFDSVIAVWRESLSKATEENVSEGMDYVRRIDASGGTNINDAVLKGVNMLLTDRREKRLPERSVDMIILLTDGNPNSGESDPSMIQANVRSAIEGAMSLYCLGFGNDVDYPLLDVMSKENKGVARRIFEASDAAIQLQGFYEEVASPLLLEVDLRYPVNSVDSLTTNHYSQLFNGSEIVVAGRLMDNDLDNFMVEVFGQGFEEAYKVEGLASALDWDVMYPNEQYIFGDFTERLWAYLTIQQLLEKSKSGSADEKANATAKALDMSLRYSFVTPLTSMVVTKPETEDGTEPPLIADKLTEEQRQQAERMSHRHVPSYYARGSPARMAPMAPTYFVDGDPHFMIELPERDDALCFNINEVPGTIFNLVRDPKQGILVNGEIIGDKKIAPDGKINTYFWRFGIVHRTLGVRLEVSTQDITVLQDGKLVTMLWSDTASVKGPNVDLLLTKDRSLTVSLKDSVKFVVLLHKVWAKHPYHRDYLGFYTLDSHLLSPSVHGLLGQFYHGIEYEVSELRPGEVPEKPDATMFVKGLELNVTRGWQRDFRQDVKNGENVPCWFIHSNGTGLIDGEASDYIVSGLFKTV